MPKEPDFAEVRSRFLALHRKRKKRPSRQQAGARRAQANPSKRRSPDAPDMSEPLPETMGAIEAREGRQWTPEQKRKHIRRLCLHISRGGSLTSYVRQTPNGPGYSTLYQWLESDPTIADEYVRARERSADTLAEECVIIADSVKDAGQFDSARVNAARLRVDARKWVASKLKPKTYADRLETVTSGALTVTHTMSDEDRALALASIMRRHAIQTAPNLDAAIKTIEAQPIEKPQEIPAGSMGPLSQ